MASADSLEAMMTHIQNMEEAMVSVLMEAIMKQSAVIDATILIVVDGPNGRKWAGRNHLRQAYLDGTLVSTRDENEILVDPVGTLSSKSYDDVDANCDSRNDSSGEDALAMMESYSEDVDVDEEGDAVISAFSPPATSSALVVYDRKGIRNVSSTSSKMRLFLYRE